MTEATPDARIAELEARINALSSMMKSLMTAFMIHGLLTKQEIAPLIAAAEALMQPTQAGGAGRAELASIGEDLPAYMRERLGPAPDPDEHDH